MLFLTLSEVQRKMSVGFLTPLFIPCSLAIGSDSFFSLHTATQDQRRSNKSLLLSQTPLPSVSVIVQHLQTHAGVCQVFLIGSSKVAHYRQMGISSVLVLWLHPVPYYMIYLPCGLILLSFVFCLWSHSSCAVSKALCTIMKKQDFFLV